MNKRFVNPATLWPPISASIVSSSPSYNNDNDDSSSPQQQHHHPTTLKSKSKLVAQKKRLQKPKQKVLSPIIPYFDDHHTAFAPRSEKNPMRNHMMWNSSMNEEEQNILSSGEESFPTTSGTKLTKAQRQYQRRVQQQRIREEHRQLALAKDRQLRKRISRPGCDTNENVPVREYTNGRVGRRTFNFVNEKWCSVCNEPVEHYVNHVGRKDHALLDQHFEGIVEYDRTWSAHDVLYGRDLREVYKSLFSTSINHNSSSSSSSSSSPSSQKLKDQELKRKRESVENMLFRSRFFPHTLSSSSSSTSLISVYDKLDDLRQNFSLEECNRRLELFSMLHNLIDEGAIDHTNQRAAVNKHTIFGVFLGGHLALHYIMPSCTMNMFPAGSPDHLSNIEDFVSSSYNMETAFDMCNMKQLPGLPEHYSSKGNGLSVSGKSNVVRVLLSQLKPAILMNDEYQQEVEFAKPELFFKDDDYLFGEEFGVVVGRSDNNNNNDPQQEQQQRSKLDDEDNDDETEIENQNQNQSRRFKLQKVNHQQDENENDNDEEEEDDEEDYEFFHLQHRMNKTAATETLMAICGRSLVAELVHCRISEYVVRAERPWIGVGQMEQLVPGSTATDGGSNPPLVRFDLSSRPEVDGVPWKLKEMMVIKK